MKRFNVLLFVLSFLHTTVAFNPSWGFVVGTPITDLPLVPDVPLLRGKYISLLGRPHEGITEDAIFSRYQDYFGLKKSTKSMDDARKTIKDGSKAVDDHDDYLKEAEDPHCHFDDESFEESNARLVAKKQEVITHLNEGNVDAAREHLGRALHTLQDFYSHSNWVELGMTSTISDALGMPLNSDGFEFPLAGNLPTCQDCTYHTIFATDTEAETLKADRCRVTGVVGGDPMSTDSKTNIAICMAVPFFEVEDPDCSANLLDAFKVPSSSATNYLTTGYFGSNIVTHVDKPRNKCSHGGPFDRDASGVEGICKDTNQPFLSPHWFNHEKAAKLAELATNKYLDELAQDMCGETDRKLCAPLRLLYGLGPTLAFVIDTTGSMGTIIAGVQNAAISIVNSRRGTEDAPSVFILSGFNDPAVLPAQFFNDPDEFIAAILSLPAVGGGDCPELAMTGLRNAIDIMPGNGNVFLWTDAAAKDASMATEVADMATKKWIQITVFQFRSICSTPEGFDLVTAQTGGRIAGNLGGIEAGRTAQLATTILQENIIQILKARHPSPVLTVDPSLSHKRQSVLRTYSHSFPVDSTVESMTVTLNNGSTLSLTRPDGTIVTDSDTDATIVIISSGAYITISSPAIGTWTAAIQGIGSMDLTVFAKSTLRMTEFELLEFRGSRHLGLFSMSSVPSAGSQVLSRAIVAGDYRTVGIEVRSLSGAVLDVVEVATGSGADEYHAPKNYLFSVVMIPSVPFNVYLVGEDATGATYQRVLPGVLNDIPASNTTTNNTLTTTSTSISSSTIYRNTTTSTSIGTTFTSFSTLSNYSASSTKGTNSTYSITPVSSSTLPTSISNATYPIMNTTYSSVLVRTNSSSYSFSPTSSSANYVNSTTRPTITSTSFTSLSSSVLSYNASSSTYSWRTFSSSEISIPERSTSLQSATTSTTNAKSTIACTTCPDSQPSPSYESSVTSLTRLVFFLKIYCIRNFESNPM
jgi:hypothetical protein